MLSKKKGMPQKRGARYEKKKARDPALKKLKTQKAIGFMNKTKSRNQPFSEVVINSNYYQKIISEKME